MVFRQHSIESAPNDSRAALEAVRMALGFVPNLFATLAESPVALEGYVTLDAVLSKGTFRAAERQIIDTAVSSANGCAYCTAAHSTFAARMRVSQETIMAARAEGVTMNARMDALIRFTQIVVRARGHIAPGELQAFLDAGFTPAQALEVVAHVGLKTISNYIDGFAHFPLDEAFQEQKWQSMEEAA